MLIITKVLLKSVEQLACEAGEAIMRCQCLTSILWCGAKRVLKRVLRLACSIDNRWQARLVRDRLCHPLRQDP